MDPFTQKLLQRTQARKDALAKKRQESQSSRIREPLVSKDDNNKLTQSKEQEFGNPVPKPRTDNLKESKVSGHLKSSNTSPHKDCEKKERQNSTKRASLEGLVDNVKEKKARLQSKGNGNTTKSVTTGETLQDRLDRLRSQNRRGEDDAAELKKQRLLELEKQQNLRTNLYGRPKNEKKHDEGKRMSVSVEDKAAIFECKPMKRESSVTRPGVTNYRQTIDETPKRESKNGGRYIKACSNVKEGKDQQKCLKERKQNEYDRYRMEIDNDDDDVSEDDHSEGKDSCDDNPFDVTEILREADKAKKRENVLMATVEKEVTKNKQNGYESSLINADDESYDCGVMDVQYDNDGMAKKEELSDFGKLLVQKQKQLKSPIQVRNLHEIANNFDENKYVKENDREGSARQVDREELEVDREEPEVDREEPEVDREEPEVDREEPEVDREENEITMLASKNTEWEMKQSPEDREMKTTNKETERNESRREPDVRASKQTKRNAPETPTKAIDANLVYSPNSQTYKSTRTKSNSKLRTNKRRSMSFSEGSLKPVHQSGYNASQSSKYNVVTNAKGHQEHMNTKERIQDFLEAAASQQNIVLQTSQALNICLNGGEERRGNPEVIEGERFLLLATERRTACLEEVQRLKQQPPQRKTQEFIGCADEEALPPYRLPCNSNIIISEIRLPLHNEFLVALRGGKVDLGVFHFIVHVQYGPTQVQSTHVTSTIDELVGNCLHYKSQLELKDVPHDFVINIKVYGMHTKRGDMALRRLSSKSSKESPSPGLMKNIVSSLTPRRRINSDASPAGGDSPQKTIFRNSSFILVGESKLNFALIRAGKHLLTKVPSNCPLEGFIQFHADIRPEFNASASGFLTLFEDVGGYTTWNRRWCVMGGNTISFWRYPDDETKPPIGTVELKDCVKSLVTLVPRDECSRPNTFELILKRSVRRDDVPTLLATVDGGKITTKLWISADNKEDRISWLDIINCQLNDYKAWSIKPLGTKLGSIHNKDVYMCSQGSRRPSAV